MPIFEFRDLPTSTKLDRQRQRTTVLARAKAGDPAIVLGDIWCSPGTQEWHFTVGARNLHKHGAAAGFATREETARALFAHSHDQAEATVLVALAKANALRAVAGEHPLRIEPVDAVS